MYTKQIEQAMLRILDIFAHSDNKLSNLFSNAIGGLTVDSHGFE